jgi:hypothetical protein
LIAGGAGGEVGLAAGGCVGDGGVGPGLVVGVGELVEPTTVEIAEVGGAEAVVPCDESGDEAGADSAVVSAAVVLAGTVSVDADADEDDVSEADDPLQDVTTASNAIATAVFRSITSLSPLIRRRSPRREEP